MPRAATLEDVPSSIRTLSDESDVIRAKAASKPPRSRPDRKSEERSKRRHRHATEQESTSSSHADVKDNIKSDEGEAAEVRSRSRSRSRTGKSEKSRKSSRSGKTKSDRDKVRSDKEHRKTSKRTGHSHARAADTSSSHSVGSRSASKLNSSAKKKKKKKKQQHNHFDYDLISPSALMALNVPIRPVKVLRPAKPDYAPPCPARSDDAAEEGSGNSNAQSLDEQRKRSLQAIQRIFVISDNPQLYEPPIDGSVPTKSSMVPKSKRRKKSKRKKKKRRKPLIKFADQHGKTLAVVHEVEDTHYCDKNEQTQTTQSSSCCVIM